MAKKMTKAEKQAWARKMQRAKAKKRREREGGGKKKKSKKKKSATKKKRKSTKKRSTAKRKSPCPPKRKTKKRSTKRKSTKKRSTKSKSTRKQSTGFAPSRGVTFDRFTGATVVYKGGKKRSSKKTLSVDDITGGAGKRKTSAVRSRRGGFVWGCIGPKPRGCGGGARVIRPSR